MEDNNPNSIINPSYFTTHFGLPEEWHCGNIPHRNRNDLVQFVTIRLADSLPQVALLKIEEELKSMSVEKKNTE